MSTSKLLCSLLPKTTFLLLLVAWGSIGLASDADLIVPGERIGDLPPIGTAGALVREMDFDHTFDIPTASAYQWHDTANQTIWMLYVCASSDAVTAVSIYDHPATERFATAKGIGISSGEDEVLATLGTPDDVSEFRDNRSLRFAMADGSAGLTISYKTHDPASAFVIMVAVRCE